MRILVVVHDFLPETLAGTELLAKYTIDELASRRKQGEDIELGLFTSYYQAPDKTDIPVDIDPANIYLVQKKKSAALFGSWSLKARALFKQALRDFKPDVVHIFHTLFLSFDLPLLAKRAGAKVIYELHDFNLICPRGTLLARDGSRSYKIDRVSRCVNCVRLDLHPKTRRRPWLKPLLGPAVARLLLKIRDRQTQEIFDQVDAFISPSHTVAGALRNFGLPKSKLHVIPYGLPPLKKSSKQPTPKFVVGFVGTLARHKGLPVLLAAAALLDHKRFEVRLFGQIKDRELIEQIKQTKTVVYAGSFDPLKAQAVYNQFDALVAPSIWFENQPLVILQAFQTQTPVITSDIGGMKELVDDGKTGLLFPVGNASALAATIVNLASDPKLQAKIRAGQAKSPLPLSPKEHLDRILPLLK